MKYLINIAETFSGYSHNGYSAVLKFKNSFMPLYVLKYLSVLPTFQFN